MTRRAAPLKSGEPVIVAGGGVSGLSAAILLARAGASVELWEPQDRVGGLLAPISFRGVPCDRGSHRVHEDAHPLLFALTESADWRARRRRGAILLRGRKIGYPLDVIDFTRALGTRSALEMFGAFVLRPRALARFLRWEEERSQHADDDEGFERFVVDRAGRAAYEAFYRPYAEKVWGKEPSRLSRTIAKQRFSTARPVRALLRAPRARFLYPLRGMSGVVGVLERTARNLGVTFHHGKPWRLEDAARSEHRSIFYSGFLRDLIPSTRLEHRGLYLIYLAMPLGAVAGAEDTYYAPEPCYWFGRVSRVDRFSPELASEGETILSVEIPEGRWGKERDFIAELDVVIAQLVRAGILARPAAPIDAKQVYVPAVYPIYERGWRAEWQRVLGELAEHGGLFPIGRQGLFLHCNIDHCVHISEEAVAHAVAGGTAHGWARKAEAYLGLRVRD